MKKVFFIKFLFIFFSISALAVISSIFFNSHLQSWESTILILRKHTLGTNITLTPFLEIIYQIYLYFEKLITFFDKVIPFFPSFLKTFLWTENVIYTFLSLPIILTFSFLFSVINLKVAKIIFSLFLFFWLIPMPILVQENWDKFVIYNQLDMVTPWSKKIIWIWSWEEKPSSSQTIFQYEWNQKSPVSSSQISLSCLGHYQLFINDTSVYHGPSFAVIPLVYFDTINIANYIHLGPNNIKVICQYLDYPVHEYTYYKQPGLLVGGYLSDGQIKHNLADHRFWKASPLTFIKEGTRLSQDNSAAEIIDLTQKNQLTLSQSKEITSIKLTSSPRPLPLLVSTFKTPKLISGSVYDLEKLSVGYLKVQYDLQKECRIKLNWGVKLAPNRSTENYFNQNDEVILPSGQGLWSQFSRRAGRYLEMDTSNCIGKVTPKFEVINMPFDIPNTIPFKDKLDQKIYQLSLNTLSNNVQDHFEDGVDREKAMYIGDAYAISQCLMVDKQNGLLVKEMIRQFADSQREDGSFPAMTPSGLSMQIPDYSLQWASWLHYYVKSTNDIAFAKEMYPKLVKLMAWAENNSSPEGFIYNKQKKEGFEWWLFIDWTPVDKSYTFSSPLQFWYFKDLNAAAEISAMLNSKNNNYQSRADNLKISLQKYAFNPKTKLFADSFNLSVKSEQESLITNALAGITQVFPQEDDNKAAINYFQNNLTTESPFSEGWIIEWLVESKRSDLALKTIRDYWGGMVNEGATALYETYKPNSKLITSGYSHAWGCSPIRFYGRII